MTANLGEKTQELVDKARLLLQNAAQTTSETADPLTKKSVYGVIWAEANGIEAGWEQQPGGGAIGLNGQMPWQLAADLRWFRSVTSGFAVIMGRRTWQSLPAQFRPLPGRKNIVVTRDIQGAKQSSEFTGAILAQSLEAALAACDGLPAWVIGGGQIYREALNGAKIAAVTQIALETAADTFAPELAADRWSLFASSGVQEGKLPHAFTLWTPQN